jgi:DNA mismatch endonuclease, patch repair protein
MSRIRSRDTGPEVKLRRLLWRSGLRGYRLHYHLVGRPDIVFVGKKVAVFVDGCFWHGCPTCGDGRAPSSNTAYWNAKLEKNRARDRKRSEELRQQGWVVIRLWEHEVIKEEQACLERIQSVLSGRQFV